MPRDHAQSNIVEIEDRTYGEVHTFYVRNPSNQERAAYNASLWIRKHKKMVNNTFATRVQFAKRILTGLKEGTLLDNGKPFSHKPGDPDREWLVTMETHYSDLLEKIGEAMFEGAKGPGAQEIEFEQPEAPPLPEPDAPVPQGGPAGQQPEAEAPVADPLPVTTSS